ncbi:D-3-phosphoglycerate dehydrogenase [Hydrobacter penzbergensis]|uniref:D-3-phosphoglycerate dehydrogenase n=1 Tax=Hydrobacter penzbergensis TaxID=1235997 RepID=A0A8X8IFW1_9BACT|nr:phosphoglycerate dehydrogenase [Hydrobacter penzbergensis]SDW86017.1 D-3-phosphoglycerate dehydrogenase [Hydrobacter penzbergensis]
MKVKVSAVAFSKNTYLVNNLKADFPDAVVNEKGKRFTQEELIDYFSDAEGVIVGLEKIDETTLASLPNVKIIAKYGVGLDNIDLDACASRKVKIGWTAGVNKESVAEMALGFMLMLCRNLYVTSNQLKQGTWNKSGGWNLKGKTVGIIGLGHIGKHLAKMLTPFECNILGNDIVDIDAPDLRDKVVMVDKETLFAESDIISIHAPLDASTIKMINKAVFSKMKRSAFIINTARGGIIDEAALKEALKEGLISGAAIDVYEKEPPEDTELLSFPNLICTPHIAGNAYEAVVAMGEAAIYHLKEYLKYKNG